MGDLPLRLRNALARLRRGLPPGGGTVSPEVPDDLYQAHLSIYEFASRFAQEKRVLDLGCGTGYGAAHLLRQGAAVLGVDPAPRSLAYARRRFRAPGLDFLPGRAEELPPDLGAFGLIVAANVLAHVTDADAALAAAAGHLAPAGVFVVSVPPILDGQTLARHRALPGHRSNFFLWEWEEKLRGHFRSLRLFRHLPPPGVHPDFARPARSRLRAEDFRFEEIPAADLYDVGFLGAVFVLGDPQSG